MAAASSAPRSLSRPGSPARRAYTACVRRSSSGASSRNAYGRALRSSWQSGDGSVVSRASSRSSPRWMRSRIAGELLDSPSPPAGSRASSADERMIGNLAIAGDVLEARGRVGKHRRHQIVGHHALQRRRDLLAVPVARHGQRDRRVPAPARLKHRRVEKRLHQHVARRRRVQIAEDVGERERVLRSERQQQAVFGRRRLQLEIELPAEALAQRQSPRLVDAAAERRVQHELHAARFVEEALEDQRVLRRQRAERGAAFGEVADGLLGRRLARRPDSVISQSIAASCRWRRVEPSIDRGANSLTARESSSLRAGASPSQNGSVGGAPCASATRTTPGPTCGDLPRGVAELKDVAGVALDGEVFVERADERVLGIEHDAVVGLFGNRAAGRDRQAPRAAPAAHAAVDFVAMDQRAARGRACVANPSDASAPPRRTSRDRARDTARRAARARTARLRRSPRTPISATICCASTSSGASCDTIASSSPRRVGAQQRRAFDEVVARDREQAALRQSRHRMAGAADALQERRDAMRRSDLADEIDVADVDAELQRRRRDQRLELPVLQPRLGVQPLLLRQAAVMRGDRLFAEALAQLARDPLGHAPRVDEDERRPVRLDERGQPRRSTRPRPRATSPRRAPSRGISSARSIARRWPSLTMAHAVASPSRVRCRRGSARRLRSASASPTGRAAAAGCAATRCSRSSVSARCAPRRVPMTAWISSTITVRDGPQHLAAALPGEQQIQRLGRRHENVRRLAQHRRPLGWRRVAGAHRGRDRRRVESHRLARARGCRAAARRGSCGCRR